jgi:hypothetical protein
MPYDSGVDWDYKSDVQAMAEEAYQAEAVETKASETKNERNMFSS